MKAVKLKNASAFTLLELLLVVVVLAVLLALLYPVGKSAMESSRSVKCMGRLKDIGVILNSYSAENNGRLRFFRDGNNLSNMGWYVLFKKYAGFSEAQAQKSFGCPSLPTEDVWSWYCYGMRASGAPGARISQTIDGVTGPLYVLSVFEVPERSKFLMAADTIGSNGKQIFRIVPPGLYSEGGIQIRHQGKANALFLDGHVEGLDSAGLYAAGIETVYDPEIKSVSTKPVK